MGSRRSASSWRQLIDEYESSGLAESALASAPWDVELDLGRGMRLRIRQGC